MKKLITLLFLLLTFLGIEQSHAAKFSGLKSIQSGGTTRQYYLMLDNKPEKKKEFVVSKYGDLRIKDGYVADASGKKVSLMGPSLYWSCIEPLWWSRETVKYLVDKYNIQIIRLPVAIAPGPGGYGSGRTSLQYPPNTWNEDCYYYRPDYTKKLVDDVVEAAIENDIYVIIDFHEHYAEDWTYMACEFFSYFARKWGNYPNVLYEIYNEPVCDKGTVINYAKQVIPTIRAIDPDNIIIVGSPNYSREPHTVTDAGQGQSNIAYSWHGYVRYNHQSDWDSSEASSWNTSVPVIVTEWGVWYNKDDGGLLNMFKERGVINCFWSMSNLGGDEAAWSVLIPSCNKKSDWTEADMTENGAFLLAQTKGWVDFKPVSLVDEPEDSPEVYTEFDEALNGPTAVAFAMTDPAAPAKILLESADKTKKVSIKCGMVDGAYITPDGVKELATLPPKEVLIAKLLGTMSAPISGLARVLNETIAGLARVLNAIAEK